MRARRSDRRIRKVIKSYYAKEISAEECRRKLQNIFDEPTLEDFLNKKEGMKDFPSSCLIFVLNEQLFEYSPNRQKIRG